MPRWKPSPSSKLCLDTGAKSPISKPARHSHPAGPPSVLLSRLPPGAGLDPRKAEASFCWLHLGFWASKGRPCLGGSQPQSPPHETPGPRTALLLSFCSRFAPGGLSLRDKRPILTPRSWGWGPDTPDTAPRMLIPPTLQGPWLAVLGGNPVLNSLCMPLSPHQAILSQDGGLGLNLMTINKNIKEKWPTQYIVYCEILLILKESSKGFQMLLLHLTCGQFTQEIRFKINFH